MSRFNLDLTVEIVSPDIEDRIAILRKKAYHLQINIPDECYVYIAEKIQADVRKLEGVLNKISAFSTINQTDITYNSCQTILL